MISIIMPIYNAENTLSRSIESVLNQTYKDIELILVNDGSKDNSESVCLNYQKKDSRIKYIYQENAGVAEARNNGISHVSGDYVTFLDADDFFDANFCKKMLDNLLKYKSDISICMNYNVYQSRNTDGSVSENICKQELKIRKPFSIKSDEYDFYDRHGHWTVWGALFRKNLILETKFRKGLYVGEDTYYLAEVIRKAKKISYIDEHLLYYIIGLDTASHGNFDEKKYTELESWRKIIALYSDRPKQMKNIKATYGKRCLKIIKFYYSSSELFRKNYYKKTISAYRKNAVYVMLEDLKKLQLKFLAKHIVAFVIPRIAFKYASKTL